MLYDFAIIGLGPAGLKAAQVAAGLGKSVVAFEKHKVGGTCLNSGCVPTKAILHLCTSSLPWEEIQKRKNAIVEKFNKAVEKDLLKRGVEVVFEEATLKDGAVFCNGRKYEAKKIIVATGSKPKSIKGLEFDGKFILSSNDILNLPKLPKSIVIVGSGAIGTEWARIMSSLGVDTTVVEAMHSLLPQADVDVQKRLERMFKMKKIKFFTNAVAKREGHNKTALSNGVVLESDVVLVAAGREAIKPKHSDTATVIGDALGEIMLAHCATHQAIDAVLGTPQHFEMAQVPMIVYGEPEIAYIGLREQDLFNDISEYKIYNLPVAYLPKAWCDEATEGFIKIITRCGQILGAHIISKEASALITQIAIAMRAKMPIEELKKVVFPHPTFSEGIFEAIENA